MSHSFLLVRLGSLGDVIHAIPAAAALRARFPESRIDWMVDPRYVPVVEMVQGVNSPIAIDTRQPGRTVATIRDLRRVGYTAALDFQGLLKSAVLARLVRAERTVGFARDHLRERSAASFYTHRVEPRGGPHVVLKNLALLEPLGSRDARVSFPLDIPYSAAAEAAMQNVQGAPHALLNPGAAWTNKRWPADRFGALASALAERHGLRSLVLWGPGEEGLAEQVVHASSGAAMVAPKTSLTDLFSIARQARVLVSGDTGPLHIAGAVGTPLVALFGPTYAERNGPWVADDVVVSRTDRCSCLYKRRCREAARCIDDIEIAEVVNAVERRLSHT